MIKVNGRELLKALEIANQFVSKQSTLPVLGYIQLDSSPGERRNSLLMWATDLTKEVMIDMPVVSGTLSPACVEIARFIGLVKHAITQDGTLCLEWIGEEGKETHLKLSHGSTGAKNGRTDVAIPAMSAEEFPPHSYIQWEKMVGPGIPRVYDIIELKDGLDKVWRMASDDEARPVLECVWINMDDTLGFGAADGFRLATCNMSPARNKELDLVVPKDCVKKLLPLLGKSYLNGKVVIKRFLKDTTGQYVMFGFPVGILNICVASMGYADRAVIPDYVQVLPTKELRRSCTINKQLLLDTLKQMTLVTGEKYFSVFMRICKDYLHIWGGEDTLYTAAIDCIQTVLPDDQPVTFAVQSRFIKEILLSMSGETCTIKVDKSGVPVKLMGNVSLTPIILISDGKSDYGLMPLALNTGHSMFLAGIDPKELAKEIAYFNAELESDWNITREELEKDTLQYEERKD